MQEEYGYLGIDTRDENIKGVEEIAVFGYPYNKEKYTMWYGEGTFKVNINNLFLLYSIPTEKGQSGGPIIKRKKGNYYIVGVHIGGIVKFSKNVAVLLTKEKRDIINEWVGEITGKLRLSKFLLNADSSMLGDKAMKELAEKWSLRLTNLELGK